MLLDRVIIGLLAFALAFFPPVASAQSPISAFPPGTFSNKAALDPASGGVLPITITKTASSDNNVGASSYTFSSLSVGSASATRYIYVFIATRFSGSTGQTQTSMTIDCGDGAVAMTNIAGASATNPPTNTNILNAYRSSSAQTTGTTCTFAAGYNTASLRASIVVYAVTTTTPTPSATATDVVNANSTSGSLAVPASGGVIMGNIDATGSGNVCTSITNGTLDVSATIGGSSNTIYSAGSNTSHAGSSTIFTFQCPGTANAPAAGFMAIGP